MEHREGDRRQGGAYGGRNRRRHDRRRTVFPSQLAAWRVLGLFGRGGVHEMARAIPKAAAAASPPMSTVWSALRRGAVPVK